jgi:hypothetical protein
MDNFRHDVITIGDGGAGSIKRSLARDSLFLAATLCFADEARPRETRARNLSAGGVMAECGRTVPTGTRVAIEIRGIGEVDGRVAWCAAGRVGISFDTPVDPRLARKPVGPARHEG